MQTFMFSLSTMSLFIPVITSMTGILLGWLIGRRKSKIEVDLLEVKRLESLIALWKDIADNIKIEYVTLRAENKELINKINDLDIQLDAVRKENEKLLKVLRELKKQQNGTNEK